MKISNTLHWYCLGVFTKDSTTDWSGFNNNSLPNVIVSELEIQYQSNKLIARKRFMDIDLQITNDVMILFFAQYHYCGILVMEISTSFNPSHTYTNFGKIIGPLGSDSIIAQGLIDIHPANPCITVLPPNGGGFTQYSCTGTLYDVGGPNGNYYDNNDSWITISPLGATNVTLNFTDFDIEARFEIFDGNSITSPSLGYCNTLTGSWYYYFFR